MNEKEIRELEELIALLRTKLLNSESVILNKKQLSLLIRYINKLKLSNKIKS